MTFSINNNTNQQQGDFSIFSPPKKKFKIDPLDLTVLRDSYFGKRDDVENYYELRGQNLLDYLTCIGHPHSGEAINSFFEYLRSCNKEESLEIINSLPTTLILNNYGESLLQYAIRHLHLIHVHAIIKKAVLFNELTIDWIPCIYKELGFQFSHEFTCLQETDSCNESCSEEDTDDDEITMDPDESLILDEIKQAIEPWAKKWDHYYDCYHNLNTAVGAIQSAFNNETESRPLYMNSPNSKAPFAYRPNTFQYPAQRKNIKMTYSLFLQSLFHIRHAKEITDYTSCTIFKLKNYNTNNFDEYRIYHNQICRNGQEIASRRFTDDSHPYFTASWLANLIRGDKLEEIITNNTHHYKKVDDEYWNEWEKYQANEDTYKLVVHPLLKSVIEKILESQEFAALKNGSEAPVIIDICAGKGDLARSILEDNPSIHYTLLELNEESVKQAAEKLGNLATVVKTDVVNDNYFYRDVEKTIPFGLNSVDIVVGSGALTFVVLEGPEEGMQALSNITKYLKPGGFLVLSGKAALVLTSDDFEKAGYMVLNKVIHHPPKNTSYQLYILRKNNVYEDC